MTHTLLADSIFLLKGGRTILNGAWLSAQTGHITALFGRNGSGKSCLLNIIYGSLKTEYGTTRIDGHYLRVPYKYPHLLQYLPAYSFTPPSLKLRAVLADFGLTTDQLLHDFPEFAGRENETIAALSSGERRLVELYAIIMSKSVFALLDEPFLYLSPIYIERLVKIIQQKKEEKGFIITDHQHETLFPVADKKMVLVNGQISQVYTPADLEVKGYLQIKRADA